MRMKASLLIFLLVTPVAAAPMPAVVELFTAQGCSSCPPADQLLGELAGRSDVLALAYHVDYWDRLGWTDRFSSADATARQRLYAKSMGLGSIYTPQMVVDGDKDLIGSDRPAVLAALKGARDGIVPAIRNENGHLHVALPASGALSAELTLVAFQREAETKVARGENAGKTLREFAIVRSARSLGSWDGAAKDIDVDLAALPPGCSDAAILIQKSKAGAVIGAARIPI